MKYTRNTFSILGKKQYDLGIDLLAAETTLIPSGGISVVDTGVSMEFPLFSKAKRTLTKVIFGVEITGIGGLIWPRSRSDYIIMAGVVDPGYRGSIKVKIYNPTDFPISIPKDYKFAQLVLVPCYHLEMEWVSSIDVNTERGASGGINKIAS